MKYLIVSDIHGSLPAMDAVLSFYKAQHCNKLLILGDILNYGPRNGIFEGLDAKGVAGRLNEMADDVIAVREIVVLQVAILPGDFLQPAHGTDQRQRVVDTEVIGHRQREGDAGGFLIAHPVGFQIEGIGHLYAP